MSTHDEEPDFDDDVQELETTTGIPATGSITFTINMDQYLSSGTLEEKIAVNIANYALNKLEATVKARAIALVEERIETEFNDMAAAKLLEVFDMPFQKYDQWGTKIGDPIVLRQMILKRMDDYLKETVRKRDGQPETAGYNADKNLFMSRMQWMVQELAIKPLNSAVEAQIKTVAAQVKGMVQNSVSAYIAQELSPKMPAVPQISNGL